MDVDAGDAGSLHTAPTSRAGRLPPAPPRGWRAYGGAVLLVALCTAIAAPMHEHLGLADLAMIYLLGVVATAIAFGRGPAIVSALLSVAAYNFSFVPPRFTFYVAHAPSLVTLGVMLVVAVVTGTLTAWLRDQLEHTRRRERQAVSLHRLSHALASTATRAGVAAAAAEHGGAALGAPVEVIEADADGRLPDAASDAAARWAFEHGEIAGLAGQRFDIGGALVLPLRAGARTLGVLRIGPDAAGHAPAGERFLLARALASQTARAMERCRLSDEAERARRDADAERARGALLESVSHDLRTPLAAIVGAASSLRDGAAAMPEATRRELADGISEEVDRLNRRIGALLDMTRVESGTLRARKEWHSIEEVIGAALARLETALGAREVRVRVPPDLPLMPLDDVLFEQVVWNLVENAHKYAPAGTAIDIDLHDTGDAVVFALSDRGPGLPPGEEARVFETFYRGRHAGLAPGFGLGLAIARGLVEAHGGTLEARNRDGGGACFTVRLPREGEPPSIEPEGDAPESPA